MIVTIFAIDTTHKVNRTICMRYIQRRSRFRFVILSAAKDLSPDRDPSLRSELALERSEGMTKPDGLFFEMYCPSWVLSGGCARTHQQQQPAFAPFAILIAREHLHPLSMVNE